MDHRWNRGADPAAAAGPAALEVLLPVPGEQEHQGRDDGGGYGNGGTKQSNCNKKGLSKQQ